MTCYRLWRFASHMTLVCWEGGRCIRMWIDVSMTLAVDLQVFLSDEVASMSRSQDCADVADTD